MRLSYRDENNSSRKCIFPQKLWQMVNDRQLDSAIRWAPDGLSFQVFEQQFERLCLGKENRIFFTTQTKSFVRQLHLYGFKKINKNQFVHPYFQRDQPGLVKNIKRHYSKKPRSPTTTSTTRTITAPEQPALGPTQILASTMAMAPVVQGPSPVTPASSTMSNEPCDWHESIYYNLDNFDYDNILTLYNTNITL